jgi:hypothetical protein
MPWALRWSLIQSAELKGVSKPLDAILIGHGHQGIAVPGGTTETTLTFKQTTSPYDFITIQGLLSPSTKGAVE